MNQAHQATNQGSGGIVQSVKQRATAQLDSQKGRASDGLSALAQAARQTTDQLRNDQHDTVAQYIDSAAEQIERLASSIQQKDVGELLRDVQALARRRPALFIGGSFVAGMLVARFLKSSQQNGSGDGMSESTSSYGSQRTSQDYPAPTGTARSGAIESTGRF